MTRQRGNARRVRAPMFGSPWWPCGTARMGDRPFNVSRCAAEFSGGESGFLAARTQLHREFKAFRGAAKRLLIHHAVGRTAKLIRGVNGRDVLRNRWEWWLSDRERD